MEISRKDSEGPCKINGFNREMVGISFHKDIRLWASIYIFRDVPNLPLLRRIHLDLFEYYPNLTVALNGVSELYF